MPGAVSSRRKSALPKLLRKVKNFSDERHSNPECLNFCIEKGALSGPTAITLAGKADLANVRDVCACHDVPLPIPGVGVSHTRNRGRAGAVQQTFLVIVLLGFGLPGWSGVPQRQVQVTMGIRHGKVLNRFLPREGNYAAEVTRRLGECNAVTLH